jgi:hypothetical protein
LVVVVIRSSPDTTVGPNVFARARRREGLHLAACARDGSDEFVVGNKKTGTRRADLQFEMETDGRGRYFSA